MKKMKKFYILLLLSCCWITGANAQSDIVWVHGLNGGQFDWVRTGNFLARGGNGNFPRGRIANHYPGLNTGRGVEDMSMALDDTLPGFRVSPNDFYAIGYSMGGTALRHTDVLGGRPLDGIITVCAPLQGTGITNNNLQGLSSYVEDSVYNLLRGIQAQLLFIKGVKNFATKSDPIGRLFRQLLYREAFYSLAVYLNGRQTLDDLSLHSPYVSRFDVPFANTATPRIHIAGSEHTPVAWRFLSSFAGGADTELPNAMRTISNIALGFSIANAALGTVNLLKVVDFGISSLYFFHAASEWKATYDYFKEDGIGNAQWTSKVLRSFRMQRTTYNFLQFKYIRTCHEKTRADRHRSCRRWGWFGFLCRIVHSVVTYISCFFQNIAVWVTGHYDEMILEPSDGLIPLSSQLGQGPWETARNLRITRPWSLLREDGGNARTEIAEGVNHAEGRDHPMVRFWLEESLQGRVHREIDVQ